METYAGKSVNGVPFDENGNVVVSSVNTAFVEKTYASIMSVPYNQGQPNFEINLTGDLNLTVTGTTNGDSAMVNLYFSGTEVATLNGLTSLIITGASNMISCYFIHDLNGLRWYNQANSSLFALQDGTILYHLANATNTGTFSNVGNICTGIGTTITNAMIGAKITKSNGEVGIIATRTSNTEFTTETHFLTDSIDSSFAVRCVATKINTDGSVYSYDFEGNLVSNMNIFGGLDMLGLQLRKNQNIYSYGYEFGHGLLKFYSDGNLITNYPYYASEALAIADSALNSGKGFRVTGSNLVYVKP